MLTEKQKLDQKIAERLRERLTRAETLPILQGERHTTESFLATLYHTFGPKGTEQK